MRKVPGLPVKVQSVLEIAKVALFTALLAACGAEVNTPSNVVQPTAQVVQLTPEQSSRTLSQGTFGPTVEEINRLNTMGTAAWFNDQFAKPQTFHFAYMSSAQASLAAGQTLTENQFLESFWQQAINGDDQLRQRVAFALSQIFVISYQNNTLAGMPRGVAQYYDTLGAFAFGNFRELLEAVTLHPMMGNYLSALSNQKTVGARVPDENYAREIMQLFTIGLRELNQDGTDTTSPATDTYTSDDIKGLAKVFTGWSWAGPDKSPGRFFGFNSPAPDPNRDWLPMQNYPQYHETLDKVFLGVAIPANTPGVASLKIALDTLFNHPNVGPFIGRELIQRLVTSNPSPAYVARVAAAFANNGQGVRGDMKAVIKAILLDAEALTPPTGNSAGKLREPVIRLANWMRAFHANSSSGSFKLSSLDNINSLGQTPMRSPSVFNFYRPDYQPPNTSIAAGNLVAPEMQITEETSVVGYLNFMRDAIPNGTGIARDIKADYTAELALAGTPDLLLDRINLLLMQNQMSSTLRAQILAALGSNANNSAKNKVYLAIFLTMASPEYLVQK